MAELPKSLEQVAFEEGEIELTDSVIYSRLARLGPKKNEKIRDVFQSLKEMEREHIEFWKKHAGGKQFGTKRFRLYLMLLMWRVLGASFTVKYLEGHEKDSIERFKRLEALISIENKPAFDIIVQEEGEQWKTFAEQVQSSYVKYISFIILGLADALVEIAGIHAGSLGIYNSTELTGVAGIVAGAAASIAMASAAYAQAKQGFEGSASLSATYTGVSYFVSATFLAIPYFLTRSMGFAIGSSLFIGVCIIAITSYYNSVISSTRFMRAFVELAGVMFVATAALLVFGTIIRGLLGITV